MPVLFSALLGIVWPNLGELLQHLLARALHLSLRNPLLAKRAIHLHLLRRGRLEVLRVLGCGSTGQFAILSRHVLAATHDLALICAEHEEQLSIVYNVERFCLAYEVGSDDLDLCGGDTGAEVDHVRLAFVNFHIGGTCEHTVE